MNFKANQLRLAIVTAVGTIAGGIVQMAVAQNAVAPPANAPAAPPVAIAELNSTDLLNLLVSEGVISREAAVKLVNTLRMRAERAGGQQLTADESTVVIPYIPPHVEARIAELVKKELAAEVVADAKREGFTIPEWTNRVRVSGDVRVRYNGDFFPSDNPEFAVYDIGRINSAGGVNAAGRSAYINVVDDRHRLLGRTRLRITASPAEHYEIGLRLTSGNAGNPVSANQTLGRYGAKWESNFDLAYIQYKSDRLLFSAGRMENQWLSTDLVWDRDMTFEGLFAQVSPLRISSDTSSWNAYLNVGAFPLQEIHQFQFVGEELAAPDDKWLYSLGIGSAAKFENHHSLDVALTYHEYKNITGVRNPAGSDIYNVTAPPFAQWGNVMQNIAVSLPGGAERELYGLAGEFELLNLTARYQYSGFERHQLSFAADYVKNLAWDALAVSLASNADGLLPDRDQGYQIEMGFGTKRRSERGDWGASIAYRYLEGDAVVDAFADSDFLMGGTNAQGCIIKGQRFIAENVWLELTLMSADEVDFPITSEAGDLRKDSVMLDLNARF